MYQEQATTNTQPASARQAGKLIGAKPQKTLQSPDKLYKAPKDYTKPLQTIQSPNRLYQASTDYTKPRQTIESPQKAIQRQRILDKAQQY